MHTVVETVPYLADADRLFSAEEQATIVDTVSANPRCGVVMPGAACASCAFQRAGAASAVGRE